MNILIVEDEKVAARRLARLTAEILGDKVTSLECRATLEESQAYLAQHPVDVLLLDLNLNGQNGFELLESDIAESFLTIVVSANTDRAVYAYEYGVLDFVPKPFDKERLILAFERLEKAAKNGPLSTRVLVVKNQAKLQLIPLDTIAFLQGAGDYVEVHLRDGGTVLHNKSLETLEGLLPAQFVRIHKSYIVDMTVAAAIHVCGGGRYELEMRDATRLPVGRAKYKELAERLSGSK